MDGPFTEIALLLRIAALAGGLFIRPRHPVLIALIVVGAVFVIIPAQGMAIRADVLAAMRLSMRLRHSGRVWCRRQSVRPDTAGRAVAPAVAARGAVHRGSKYPLTGAPPGTDIGRSGPSGVNLRLNGTGP